jgi:hypothetical protein
MTRSLDSTLESNLTSKQLRIADLIELHLSTAVYFTNAFIDISYDSPTAPDSGANTYLAQGQFLGFGAVNETRDIRVANLALTFTAVDFTTIALVLNNDYIDRRVVLYRALLNDNLAIDTNQVWQYFDGRISDFTIRETDNTAQLTLSVSSQFADYEKTAGRRTNNESQQRFFSTDVGMEFAPQIQTDIKWGRV